MSAGIIPDIYRHTARKSTVTKSIKSSNVPSSPHSSFSNGTSHLDDKHSKPLLTAKLESIQWPIKLEEDLPAEPLILLSDNEIEQMIVEEDPDRTIEDILDDLLQQVERTSCQQTTNAFPDDIQEIQQVIHSMLNFAQENDPHDGQCSDEITPMESEQQATILSEAQTNGDDIEEIPAIPIQTPSSCTCQCHLSISPLNNEFVLFEQALKQIRNEQEHEKSLTNNHLIQTLKRQHDELLSIYQQNKIIKPISSTGATRIDREQQTIKLHSNDSQIQTDFINAHHPPTPQQHKPVVVPATNVPNVHTNGLLTATRIHNNLHSSHSTPGPSLQQTRPRLSANAVTSTAATRKTTVAANSSAVPAPVPVAAPPPPLLPAAASHDVVDLTEEDEDDATTSRVPIQRAAAPVRQNSTSIQLPTPAAATAATRIRPVNRMIRPNNSTPASAQTFPLRSLPEHIPCDHNIARPQLSITQENATVRLTWNLPSTPMESIQTYEIYAYKQNATVVTSDWKKIGTVKSMRLPMAVTLKEFQSNSHYAFAVRAISITNRTGPFCEPKTIFTGNTPVQPLHTSQLLNVSTT